LTKKVVNNYSNVTVYYY